MSPRLKLMNVPLSSRLLPHEELMFKLRLRAVKRWHSSVSSSCVSVHSGLDPGPGGRLEGCRDRQRLQRRRPGPSAETRG